eukprot:TRINITY_DN56354_c0_g1_i1.p1 TRINITY_DN56354_c0_g1~~TRINITY_DN56354_c0_g1_i1.p1  ORF type:complete len:215 (+),score=22.68 TRINITY_DN56354_c0_g1_i1:263-907(+)
MDFFWLTFLEILRVTDSRDGHVFLLAPSHMQDHGHFVPPDSWRFLRDAGGSLLRWGRHSGYAGLYLLQSFVSQPTEYQQDQDCVMTFVRRALPAGVQPDQRADVRIPTRAPATRTAVVGRILSLHACWRSAPEVLRAEQYVMEGTAMTFPLACCTIYEAGFGRPGAAQGSARSLLADLAKRCWGVASRSYGFCCPYIMADAESTPPRPAGEVEG